MSGIFKGVFLAFSSFFKGVFLVFEGISFFYKEKCLWKYTLGPWLLLIFLYTGMVWLMLRMSRLFTAWLSSYLNGWPDFLQGIAAVTITVTAVLFCALLILTTLCTLFEIFGGLFFDKLLEECNRRYYKIPETAVPLKSQLFFAWQGTVYGLKSTLLLCILMIASLLLPVFGQILMVAVMGKRMAYAFLFAPGFLKGKGIDETRKEFKNRKWEVAGFGICVYLIQLIPLSLPFTLPGMVTGALMLYNGKIPEKTE